MPGGRVKGFIFLLHPGPSLLVTATFVAITGLAMRRVPPLDVVMRLVFVMLPAQFAIGIVNDLADVGSDAHGKPYKPLVRGLVRREAAVALSIALVLCGLAVAASLNLAVLAVAALGLSAGLLYDMGLRRTPWSLVPWWLGISALPLAAFAAAGRLEIRLLLLLPLALLVALGLHCANVLPDIDSDRDNGLRSLPVVLGADASRPVAIGSLAVALALALGLWRPLHQSGPFVLLGAAVLAVVLITEAVRRTARPFPALALATAFFAVCWMAALPG